MYALVPTVPVFFSVFFGTVPEFTFVHNLDHLRKFCCFSRRPYRLPDKICYGFPYLHFLTQYDYVGKKNRQIGNTSEVKIYKMTGKLCFTLLSPINKNIKSPLPFS